MKPARRASPKPHARWLPLLAALAVIYLALEVYGPALRGPFLYDDITLPFLRPDLAARSLWGWMVNVRPLLMLSYWLNFQLGDTTPLGYHLLNLGLHLGTSALLGLAIYRLLGGPEHVPERRAKLLAAGAALVFLFHPIHTEAVAYVASRSETLSVFLFLAAFTVFLYTRRDEGISWPAALGVLALFACAVSTKEHTAVLPLLLLFTERFWFASSWREVLHRHWRLWIPLATGGLAAGLLITRVLLVSTSAGFSLNGLRWYEYFFTQCRVIPLYIRLALFPVNQNFDYDLPVSHTLLQNGAWLGLAFLLVCGWAAWRYRQQYPLATYGFVVFLLLLAPTSSVVPIRDVVAERRLYLPMIGLLLLALEWVVRWRKQQVWQLVALGSVISVFAVAAYQRNQLWGSPTRLWEDTVAKSPGKARLYQHLAQAYISSRNCQAALDLFSRLEQTTGNRVPPDLLVHWARAYECMRQPEEAIAKLRQAAEMAPDPSTYHNIGRLEYRQGRPQLARAAFERSIELHAPWDLTYTMLGDILFQEGDVPRALEQYRRAVQINPENQRALFQVRSLEASRAAYSATSAGGGGEFSR